MIASIFSIFKSTRVEEACDNNLYIKTKKAAHGETAFQQHYPTRDNLFKRI